MNSNAYANNSLPFFEKMVDLYGESLIRLAFTYVKDRQIAEDIVQDVFIRAFEKYEQFQGNSSYKTYLCRITINRSHDYLRSWTYKNVIFSNKISMFLKNMDSIEKTVLAKDESYLIGKEVLSLPIKYREVVVLYYYKELSIGEISEILNCSDNTVKTRLKRARERLKGKLEGKVSENLE